MKQRIPKFHVPQSKEQGLPEIGAFGRDDFHRARYYSAVIERYAKPKEVEILIAFAREKRIPSMSFADVIEAMARFIHAGDDTAVARMIANTQKPADQTHAEIVFTEDVRRAMQQHGSSSERIYGAMIESLTKLFPESSLVRVLGALQAGNSPEGFRPGAVIETMFLTASS